MQIEENRLGMELDQRVVFRCAHMITCVVIALSLSLPFSASDNHDNIVSTADADEFAAYDFSEFTEEDFARIDAEVIKNQLPKTTIAYEVLCPPQDSKSELDYQSRDSPLDLFRQYGSLSVTDLVSLSWCEVQFEYGLLGRRSRPVHQRPRSFKSASGKEIKLDTAVATKNDTIIRKGRAIHKTLEREVKPKEVIVLVSSAEERWALRLVNMLACLDGLQLEGMTREMPVFGIEDGEIIVGIIDELVYRPIAQDEGDRDHATDSSQTNIESFPPSSARSKTPSSNSFTIQIIDTKTRRRPSLPLDDDMLPSRLQLMLYHRLLSKLISTTSPFDFMIFWQLVNVDPEQQLSSTFLEQSGLIAEKSDFQVLNLADLSALWHDRVYQLQIAGVDDQLKLVYLLQVTKTSTRRRKPPSASAEATPPPKQVCQTPKDNYSEQETYRVDPIAAGKGSITAYFHAKRKQHQILGTKTFRYDSELLSAYLVNALAWWRGERRSAGVPVELAHRCNACEYYNDCEWREERAKEFHEQTRLKRETSQLVV